MADLIWLALLAPAGAALASWRTARPLTTGLGAAATFAGVVGVLAAPSAHVSAVWLPRNGIPLVTVGITADEIGAVVLALLLLAALFTERGRLSGRAWLSLSAAALALLAADLVTAFAGLALVSAATAPRPRALWSARLSDLIALLGLGALYHHTAALGWDVALLADSPQTVLICALLLAGAAGHLGIAPWPVRLGVVPVAVAGAVLLKLGPLLDTSAAVSQVGSAVGTLSILLVALASARGDDRAPGWSVWPALLLLLATAGAPSLLLAAILSWPVLAATRSGLAARIGAALLCSAPLSTLAADGRWLPLLLLAAALLALGMAARRRPGRPDALAALLLLAISAGVARAGLAGPPLVPPLWSLAVGPVLLIVGQILQRFSRRLPMLWPGDGWTLLWRRALRPLSLRTSRLQLPAAEGPRRRVAQLARRLALDRPADQLFLLVLAAVAVLAYAAGVSQ